MNTQARIVIVGGGIVGAQIAYHLARLGETDVILLEKGEIASGESSHAAGLVTQFATSQAMLQFRMYSVDLYTGLGLFRPVGSLRLASTRESLLDLQRSVSRAKALGLECEVIGPDEAVRIMPQISKRNLYGAIYLPRDGYLDPYLTTTSIVHLARSLGVTVYTHTRVTGIRLSPKGEIREVVTEKGNIRCEIVVNAAGMWAPRVAAMAGLHIPTTPVDHQHVALQAVPGHEFDANTPCLRDPENLVYMRPEHGGLIIGGYELNPHARWIDGVPWEHGNASLPPDMDRFAPLLEGAIRRIPFLEQAGIIRLICHPGAYTPDCQPILGPMAGVRGFWMAAGFSLHGYGGAGGVGKLMAEWILGGQPTLDVYPYKATRFGQYYADPSYAAERTRECVRYYYRLRFPHDEYAWVRPRRLSPLHHRLQEMGAVFGEKFGWERVNYFEPGKPWRRMGEDQRNWGGWVRPPFFERVGQEHQATRQRVTLFDLTPFGKIEVSGPGALSLLNWVADSEINTPIGKATYTQFLNSNGGIEADLTVTRLGPDRFWVITGSAFVGNDKAWLEMHLDRADGPVSVRDVSEEWACLALWGPRARQVLSKVTPADLSNQAHPYLMTRPIPINGVQVYAQRVSYAGELGWELYVPPHRATMVWDLLMEAGQEFGIEVGGYKALDSLRLEKGYRYYSVDMTQLETPYEAGLGFCAQLDKADFLGKAALLRQKEEGVRRRLCTLIVERDDFTQIYGGEALYHEGQVISRVRSGGWGYTVEKNILYAYLPIELAHPGQRFEAELIEGRQPVVVTPTVLYDPRGERLRA